MVGLLFIFLIMLMSFVLMYRKQSQDSIQVRHHLEQAHRLRTNMLRRVQKVLHEQGTNVDIDLKNGVLRLKAAALFDSGDAKVQPQAMTHIQRIATQLHANLVQEDLVTSVESVLVEGHTDNKKLAGVLGGGIADNWDLSYQRAKQTYQALLGFEPKLRTLRNQSHEALLSMSAYGDERPIASNADEPGRRRNRRIDIRIIIAAPVGQEPQE